MSSIDLIPKEDLPYEKLDKYGAESLTDAELLSVLIRFGVADVNPIEIGIELMRIAGADGLSGIMYMSRNRLQQIKGIGKVRATQLICVGEISKRISRQQTLKRVSLSDPKTVAEHFMEVLRHESEEQVWLALFNSKCQLIGERMLSSGTANSSLITPREVFKYALEGKAVSVIMIHNHPSGDPSPSSDDIELTNQMSDAGNIIGIKLLDHIIIGDGQYTSMLETGLI